MHYKDPGYWRDWYWNCGGREKVQARRYINEYNRLLKQQQKEKQYGTKEIIRNDSL